MSYFEDFRDDLDEHARDLGYNDSKDLVRAFVSEQFPATQEDEIQDYAKGLFCVMQNNVCFSPSMTANNYEKDWDRAAKRERSARTKAREPHEPE